MTSTLLRPPRSIANVSTTTHRKEHEDLEEEPCPAPAFLRSLDLPCASRSNLSAWTRLAIRTVPTLGIIQIPRRDTDQIVVIAQFSRLSGESQVCHGGDDWRLIGLET